MISSGDSNGDGADAAGLWLFRKQNNIQDAMVLMQQMDGKILAPKPKAKAKAKVKAKVKQESKGKGRGGGRGKAKAAPKEKARGKDGEDIMDEPEKTADYVSCQVDGVAVLRTKYFLDCLVSAIRSALINARKQFGVPLGSQPVEPEALLGPPSAHGEALVYHDHEVLVFRKCLRLGLLFALKGQLTIDKKIHRRWSTCRPHIQVYAKQLIKRDSWAYILCIILMIMTHDIWYMTYGLQTR